jgi:FkbM family methyltransferase
VLVSLRRLLVGVAILALAFAGAWLYRPARLTAIYLAGRSGMCPYGQAMDSVKRARRQAAAMDRIFSASRMVQEDPAGYRLWETPRGRFWMTKESDDALFHDLAEQEMAIYGTGHMAVRPGDVVLDCGANVGVFVRTALDRGAAWVIAIEPAPENLECLRRNFRSEIEAGRVLVCAKGVWDKEDVLPLSIEAGNSASDSFVFEHKREERLVQVPLTTIDRLVDELGLPRVDYVKMDIEGAELKALEGAQRTLARYRPKISIAAYHAPDHPERIPVLVRKALADYRMECGPCALNRTRIRPEILYFY